MKVQSEIYFFELLYKSTIFYGHYGQQCLEFPELKLETFCILH